jgi:hypothetical protein
MIRFRCFRRGQPPGVERIGAQQGAAPFSMQRVGRVELAQDQQAPERTELGPPAA